MTIISRETSAPSNKFPVGGGSNDIPLPIQVMPAKILTMGVRNPISKHTPVIASKTPGSRARVVHRSPRETYKTPWAMAVTPTITRSSSSAKPGQLPGNVEKSLCKCAHPECDANSQTTKGTHRVFSAKSDIAVSSHSTIGLRVPGEGYYSWMIPRRMPMATAWVRSLAPSFSMMCLM